MGTPAEHHEKARRHQLFLASISDEFPDWLATVAFYAAVELIELLLAERGHHSKSHFERKEALKRHFPHPELNRAFNDLYNASLDARYLPSSTIPSAADVRAILIGRRLAQIESYVKAHARFQPDSE
jgi:hypothetical protein